MVHLTESEEAILNAINALTTLELFARVDRQKLDAYKAELQKELLCSLYRRTRTQGIL